jgi:hypothetical protein
VTSLAIISLLALYFLTSVAGPRAYFLLYPQEFRSLPTLPSVESEYKERTSAIRLGVNQPLLIFGLLLGSAILWLVLSGATFSPDGFHIKGWLWATLKGGYIGLSWAGIWLWLWLVLSNPQRLRREVPGFGASFPKQVVVSVVGAFSEELWRTLCIAVLISSGFSGSFSVMAAALAFGIAFLRNGPERTILAVIEGIILGLLFVWQRSFLAPFAAHLAVEAVYLWGVGNLSQQSKRKSWFRGMHCPVCNAQLNRLQIKILEPFGCPICRKQISVSDRYRSVMRMAGTFAYIFLSLSTLVLLEHQISENLALLLLWPVAFGVGTSGLLLYQRVFPPTLQYGSPTFITLNLEQHRDSANDTENKRD